MPIWAAPPWSQSNWQSNLTGNPKLCCGMARQKRWCDSRARLVMLGTYVFLNSRRFTAAATVIIFLCIQITTLAGESPAASDNTLTEAERRDGWLLLFNGRTTAGWMNSDGTAPRTPVEDGSLNPHRAGHYMLVHTQQWENFKLTLDFKI